MNITLANIRTNKALSDETLCFSATVLIDGRKVGTVGNRGHGGCHEWNIPREILAQLEAHAATLPKIVTDLEDADDPTGCFTFQPDADALANALVEQHETRKDVERLLRDKIAYTHKSKPGIFATKKLPADVKARFLANPAALIEKWQAAEILNLVTIERAVNLYSAHSA